MLVHCLHSVWYDDTTSLLDWVCARPMRACTSACDTATAATVLDRRACACACIGVWVYHPHTGMCMCARMLCEYVLACVCVQVACAQWLRTKADYLPFSMRAVQPSQQASRVRNIGIPYTHTYRHTHRRVYRHAMRLLLCATCFHVHVDACVRTFVQMWV